MRPKSIDGATLLINLLHPHHQPESRLRDPRAGQYQTACQNHSPGPYLRFQISPTPPLNQCASQRWACQQRHTGHAEDHPHPDSGLLQVIRQTRHHGREQTLHTGSEPAVDDGPGQQCVMGGNGCPAVEQDACHKGTGNHVIERAGPTIGDVAWDETTEKANTIDDDDEVEGLGLAKMDNVPAEGTDLHMVSILYEFLEEKRTVRRNTQSTGPKARGTYLGWSAIQ